MRDSDREAYDPAAYDSEAMTDDIIDAINGTFNAEIGETFTVGYDHAFNVVTPHERKFLIRVTDVTGITR